MQLSFQEAYNILSPLAGGGVSALVAHLFKVRRIKMFKRLHDPVTESVKSNIFIENKLEDLLAEFEADRIFIFQFHNGANFYPNGKSIPKFSTFYEKCLLGISSIREKYQSIPVSIFGKFFNSLAESDVSFAHDIKRGSVEEIEAKGYVRDTDSKSIYAAAIKTIDNKFTGVLVIHYVKKKKILNQDRITELQIQASSIGSALSYQVNVK